MEFERTFDYDLIRGIMTHPSVYPHISDDGCPPAERFEPSDSRSIWYMLVRDHGELLGMWMFVPQNAVCFEVHTCLLPEGRGCRGYQAAKEMAQWMFKNSPCRRIVTTIPEYNRSARLFAMGVGLKRFGINPDSYMKGGVLYDQILLGMSKEEQ